MALRSRFGKGRPLHQSGHIAAFIVFNLWQLYTQTDGYFDANTQPDRAGQRYSDRLRLFESQEAGQRMKCGKPSIARRDAVMQFLFKKCQEIADCSAVNESRSISSIRRPTCSTTKRRYNSHCDQDYDGQLLFGPWPHRLQWSVNRLRIEGSDQQDLTLISHPPDS